MRRLEGKSVLIFGGGSKNGALNNGLAASILYAREGAEVTVVDRDADAVKAAIEKITHDGADHRQAARVQGVVGDVTDNESVRESVDKTLKFSGKIDVLHNNVGIARMGGPMEMGLDEWEFVQKVNLTSAFLTTKHVLPHMLQQRSGSIVNVASIGGMRYIGYNYPSYSATKAGLIEFTTNLALEYARYGIRANAVAPGYIETPMVYQQISGSYDSVAEMVAARDALSPTGKMGEPFDVAHAALFLASDEAKYVNAVCLPVDGGLTKQSSMPVATEAPAAMSRAS
jgi:hypothetical protein